MATAATPSAQPMPSRFAALSAGPARLILALWLALCLLGLAQSIGPIGPGAASSGSFTAAVQQPEASGDDLFLYNSIIDRLRIGDAYYPATATLLRDNNYPLRPFLTFRLPTLAILLAAIPGWFGTALLAALCAATILAWTLRLGGEGVPERPLMVASLLLLGGSITLAAPRLICFHESWAALLIALSLALHQPNRWGPSVGLALLALLIRELALPFVLLMGSAALWQRRWREAAAWAATVALFAVALALHAQAVATVVLAGDPASPGWVEPGGWARVLSALREASLLGYLPVPTTALLVPLALLGWYARPGANAMLVALHLTGFAFMMTLLGRPQNYYWIAMIVPLFLTGLAFAPSALSHLWHAATPGRRSPLAKPG
ncbi:MAG: hypothetical protein BGP16_15905 [Sphingobium sp. 66-54]|nr:MAG: hypothetical protein BGP16_15905 [Sphingobium sp. 66-54]